MRKTTIDAKNDNRKLNTIASYATKKFGIEYQGFLLRFCTHRNKFNCVFRSMKLRKYAIRSLIWSYESVPNDSRAMTFLSIYHDASLSHGVNHAAYHDDELLDHGAPQLLAPHQPCTIAVVYALRDNLQTSLSA